LVWALEEGLLSKNLPTMSLPPGWEERYDPVSKRYYYVDHVRKLTVVSDCPYLRNVGPPHHLLGLSSLLLFSVFLLSLIPPCTGVFGVPAGKPSSGEGQGCCHVGSTHRVTLFQPLFPIFFPFFLFFFFFIFFLPSLLVGTACFADLPGNDAR
jgi:hypothetical protein